MKILDKILPKDKNPRIWTAVVLIAIIAGLLTLLGIHGFREYGMALFVLTPIFIGFSSVALYGNNYGITKSQSWKLGFLTLGVYSIGLIIFAIEGLICIVMATPIGLLLTWIGSLIGFAIVNKNPNKAPMTMLLLIGLFPLFSFWDKKTEPTISSVTTSIVINADKETVWKNVVSFPRLDKPTEFIFKTGIAYPTDATIDGQGVGAIRHCNFTTGSFVEPITIWNQPNLLKFSVKEQPAPMKEISFWDIDAPHLHDYFVSKEGQFKLTELSKGKTLLEGTTWYYHDIKPEFYWRIWSNEIVHKIHERVLKHIKTNSEKEKKAAYNKQFGKMAGSVLG
ncbi:MAG: hypothetical protein MUF43_11280 [Flavobacterium sp.]|jgi:hypothetical protein|nr:hypothetical protein [Flavobacterium sp.]